MGDYFFQSIELIDDEDIISDEEVIVIVSKLDYTFTEIAIFDDEEF